VAGNPLPGPQGALAAPALPLPLRPAPAHRPPPGHTRVLPAGPAAGP
jgi:hypothetical protein